MKKKNVIIIVLCVVVVALIAVVAFLIGKNNSKDELPTYNPANTQSVATQAATDVAENNEAVSQSDIKIVKKYTLLENDDFTMVFVLENTGKGDAAVALVGKIYDGANNVAGTERESIFLDAGAKSVVELDFDTEGVKVKDDDYKISVAKASTIKPGIKNIASKHSVSGQAVNVTSTNNNNFDLQGVEAYCLFYDGDELIDVESEDVENKATEIFEKGTTQKQRLDTKESFKKLEVYYTQTQDKPDAEDDD